MDCGPAARMGCCAPASSHPCGSEQCATSPAPARVRLKNAPGSSTGCEIVLEDPNIQLASVAADLMGKSARQMLAGLLQGQADPTILAEYARGRMRSKGALLEQALQGRVTEQHR
jgi:transposase